MSDTPADFSSPPPSRLIVRPELSGLTDEQRRAEDVARLWGEKTYQPPPSRWAPPAPSSPAVLALLAFPHAANGQPLPPARPKEPPPPRRDASDQELAAAAGRHYRLFAEFEEADAGYMTRWKYWCGLDAATKSQLAFDVMFGGENCPAWSVTVPADPECPGAVLKAADAPTAVARFKSGMGIRHIEPAKGSGFADPILAVLYEPPA